MNDKKELIKRITELLEKMRYTELIAIYQAICKFVRIKTL